MNRIKVKTSGLLLKAVFLLAVIQLKTTVNSQDTTYFSLEAEEVSDITNAYYYRILERNPSDTDQVVLRQFYMNGQPKLERPFSSYSQFKRDGADKSWYENGQLKSSVNYKEGKLHGEVFTFWEDGSKKRVDLYNDSLLIEGRLYNRHGEELEWYEFIIFPEFPGGLDNLMSFLQRSIKYPKTARRAGQSGVTIVEFEISKSGEPQNAEIVQSVSPDFDQAVLKMMSKMPKWEPGYEDGEPIAVQYKLPVRFSYR